jgi:hypothetical protein
MYKCLDKSGNTIYQANKCPVNAKASTVKEADKIKQEIKTAAAKPKTLDDLIADGKKAAADIDKKIKSTTASYDEKIAGLKRQNISTSNVEAEKSLAIKDLLTEKTKAYKKNITALKQEEKKTKSQTEIVEHKIAEIQAKQAEKSEEAALPQ